MASSNLITAPKVVVYVNGLPFGQATSFSWNSSTAKQPIYGLDSGEPYEFAPGITKVGGTIGIIRTILDGGTEGLGITTTFDQLPREKYFSLALVEKTSNTMLFRADKCTVQSQSWQIAVKGFLTGSVTFEAFDWKNEATDGSR